MLPDSALLLCNFPRGVGGGGGGGYAPSFNWSESVLMDWCTCRTPCSIDDSSFRGTGKHIGLRPEQAMEWKW